MESKEQEIVIKKQIIKKIQVDDNIIIVIEGIVKSQHKSHYQAYKLPISWYGKSGKEIL